MWWKNSMTSCTTTVQKTYRKRGGEVKFNCKQAELLFALKVSHVWVTNCWGVLRNLHSTKAHAHYRAGRSQSTLRGILVSNPNLCHTTWPEWGQRASASTLHRCSCRTLLDKFLVDPETSKVFKSLSYLWGSAYNNVWVCFVLLNPETLIVLWMCVVVLD